ncbi:cytochrome c3 family protein [uncultured Microbulbifer sp.]|uniref:cytochrome c3 family protein n=1 Tax=uncultured Microbulbifer sp. TaxID=348147 RepID=UPI0026176D86|nr:cytochrome c3 family protein [uncultured Microbulbifer sp.]
MNNYKFKFWHYGLILTLCAAGLITYNLEASDKSYFLGGEATHGHHQLELACTTCHGDGFAGEAFIQQACVGCHSEELEDANDSHPRTKFLDPRNANLLKQLDARQCVACHTEHKPEITHDMGVTLASDFCVHCHSDIAENRPNHAEFTFDSCASAGCHNYHDNRYLHEEFLAARIGASDLVANGQLPVRNLVARWKQANPQRHSLSRNDADMTFPGVPEDTSAGIIQQWATSTHAQTDTNCSGCHVDEKMTFTSAEIVELCGSCHVDQRENFTQGKHGLRLSPATPETFRKITGAMTPAEAVIPMKETSGKPLSCTSCHYAHETDTRYAAVEACLGCHNDEHSLAYRSSAHFKAWQADSETGVSCANCHMPRETHGDRVVINHNQNHNLRPNEKMLPVCLNCHGVEFSVSALADEQLLENNFSQSVTNRHDTFRLIRERITKKTSSK